VPIVHGVRVTPWPITSRVRIAYLAQRTLARVERLSGVRVAIGLRGLRGLIAALVVDGRELGPGYGRATPQSVAAIETLRHGPRLDGVYSAKAAAALLRLHASGVGPLVFWASKSSTVLEEPSRDALAAASPALVRWLAT
jgi:hypothetical protein